MTKHYIEIDDAWAIILCHDIGWSDADDAASLMEAFGMDDGEIRKAVRVLMGINGGMTVSRPDLRMSLVFVGDAASGEEWIDTLAHEVDHVQDAICLFYDVPAGSEESAWLQGYIFKQIARHLNCACSCEVTFINNKAEQ